ncbi:MAG: glycosyltransferase family 4 protein [Candidatus Omnitrophica bacterium]|nr:glycosyltransferase family 4 protein [Candidatus Omnitrophota bacterium]
MLGKIKLAMISGTFPELHCGIGDYTYRLCAELKKHDAVVSVVTSQSPQIKSLEGVKLIQVLKNWDLLSLPTLLNFFRNNFTDIIHIQYPTQSYKDKAMINILPVFLKAFFPNTFLIVTIHDIKTAHIFNKIRAIPFLIFADKIILTVAEEKDYLVKRFPFLRDKLEIISIGSNINPVELSSEERGKIREKLGVKADEILLSHFGYILPKKELELLIYSVKHLHEKGQKIKLIFISDFCPKANKYHRRLESMSHKFNLEKLIIWTGYCRQEEVSKYLLSSDIGIQLYPDGVSYRRTSFLTAIGHGLPVITTVNTRLPEGLIDRGNILAVVPRDAGKLADAIEELILSKALRKDLSVKAKEFSGHFSYESIAEEHFSLYQSLIKSEEPKNR